MEKMKISEVEHGFISLVISIGFDGVCVSDEYPKIGQDIGAAYILRKLTNTGHRLILSTTRSNIPRAVPIEEASKSNCLLLKDAINWFKENDIPLWAVNHNPEQRAWSSSNRVYADLYIDNKALGAPLIYPIGEKPFISWIEVDRWLERGCYYWNGVR